MIVRDPTNPVEALVRREMVETFGHVLDDPSAFKLLFLAIGNEGRTWGARQPAPPSLKWGRPRRYGAIDDGVVESH